MKRITLGILSALAFANSAHAIEMLTKTFDAGLEYRCEEPGCAQPKMPCANQQPTTAPEACFKRARTDVVLVESQNNEFKSLQKYYEERVLSLEKQLRSHREQIANNHREIAEALIADPVFRKKLKEEIYSEKK